MTQPQVKAPRDLFLEASGARVLKHAETARRVEATVRGKAGA